MSIPVPAEPGGNSRIKEIVAVLVMALAMFTLVSLHTQASGVVGAVISSALRTTFGIGADAPAVFLFVLGVLMLRRRTGTGRVRKSFAVLLLFLVLLCGYHTVVTALQGPLTPYWAYQGGLHGEAGGIVGGFLTARMLTAFGGWGSAVVLGALAVISFSLYFETPLSRIVTSFLKTVRRIVAGVVGFCIRFITDTSKEVRDLAGMLKDRRARAAAERQSRAASRAARREARQSRRAEPQPPPAVATDPGISHEGGQSKRSRRRRSASRLRLFSWRTRRRGDQEFAPHESEPPRGARGLAALLESAPEAPLQPSMPSGDFTSASDALDDDVLDPGLDPTGEDDRHLNGTGDVEDMVVSEARTHAPTRSRAPRASKATRAESNQDEEKELTIAVDTSGDEAPVYTLPPTAILHRPKETARGKKGTGSDQSTLLEETLANFGVQAKVVEVSRGPVITRYELQPAPGIKVSRIVNLADDVALNLAAAGVRIEAPVPGKSVVGIEVPNKETNTVYLREVLESPQFRDASSKLVVGLGKDIAGNPVVADLTKLLHVLIAGATGSGKSVCINSIICSILYKALPNEVKLLMIDPKRVELAVYDGIPHLITPVVTDPKLAANALRWAVKEMESRYKKFSETGVRNISGYNQRISEGLVDDEPMPYLVVIIDELADLMLVAGNEVEDSICRLAQMARAAGIHLIIATQRPSVDVITGLIKANVPSRIAFAVSSGVDSRTILDSIGAERLIGKGDMLYYPIGANKPQRAQGAWITDKEVQTTVEFWKRQGEPEYTPSVTEVPKVQGGGSEEGDDELFDEAVQLVVETGNASISMLQRRFRIGYARAARLIDMMELQGIVGPYQGSKPREVLRRPDETHEMAN